MTYAEKKCMQYKTNELKHNFWWLRQWKCELVIRTKTVYDNKNLNECENSSSKIYARLNILIGTNQNTNVLPSGKLPFPLAN